MIDGEINYRSEKSPCQPLSQSLTVTQSVTTSVTKANVISPTVQHPPHLHPVYSPLSFYPFSPHKFLLRYLSQVTRALGWSITEYMKLKGYTEISRKRIDYRAVTSNIHGASSCGTSTVMIQSTVPNHLGTKTEMQQSLTHLMTYLACRFVLWDKSETRYFTVEQDYVGCSVKETSTGKMSISSRNDRMECIRDTGR